MVARLALCLCLLAAVATRASSSAGDRWTRRSVAGYVRARTGLPARGGRGGKRSAGAGGQVWRGRGVLTNTLTGAAIAEVDCLERCSAIVDGDEAADATTYETERILVYRNRNGTRLAPPLTYKHNVSFDLDGRGDLMVRALGVDGQAIASGWGVGEAPSAAGWRGVPLLRARGAFYRLAVRPLAKDGAAAEEPPESAEPPLGWPRVANRGAVRATREEYALSVPGAFARLARAAPAKLHYRRTGRCPTWYGTGVCTLELTSEAVGAEAAPARAGGAGAWRRRLPWRRRGARTDDADDGGAADGGGGGGWEVQAQRLLR